MRRSPLRDALRNGQKAVSDRTPLPAQFQPYEAASRFGVITCYFNPNRYRSKLRNYRLFRESLKVSGIPCITMECHPPGECSDLAEFDDVHTVISRHIMWQKERLLNLAIARLPKEWDVVAWLDCDVLFENRDWATQAVRQLNSHAVVQLFSHIVRLPRGETWGSQRGKCWNGFAASVGKGPDHLVTGRVTRHGFTGFAWAAHREILSQHGLYDSCIAGGGDHVMAHAFAGDWSSDCVDRTLGGSTPRQMHFANWARDINQSIRARMSHVPGTIFHLWHGDIVDRQYHSRHRALALQDFDPFTDLRTGEGGCWEWASDKPALHLWAAQYFADRKEDGDDGANVAAPMNAG